MNLHQKRRHYEKKYRPFVPTGRSPRRHTQNKKENVRTGNGNSNKKTKMKHRRRPERNVTNYLLRKMPYASFKRYFLVTITNVRSTFGFIPFIALSFVSQQPTTGATTKKEEERRERMRRRKKKRKCRRRRKEEN